MPGNLLILFDQTMSIQEMWQSTTKLEAAKQAIASAILAYKDSLTVGAIFLPYADPNSISICDLSPAASFVQPIEGTGNIPFQPGSQFVAAFRAHWAMSGTGMSINTPLNEAFDRADVALQTALMSASFAGRTAVLVLTDITNGTPDCTPSPSATGIPTKTEPNHAADWLSQGIATYVIGLPGAEGVANLNDIALNGGSGSPISPSDPAALLMQITQIIQRDVLQQEVFRDPACGNCASACAAPTTCVYGSCTCPKVGEVLCDGACILTVSDDLNCGACGDACTDGKICCASQCVDTKSDRSNCGTCGSLCGSTANLCKDGTCKCGNNVPCTRPYTCAVAFVGDGGMCQ